MSILLIAVLTTPSVAPFVGDAQVRYDREELRKAKVELNSKSLMKFLSDHGGDDRDLPRIGELVKKLGAEAEADRADARKRLKAIGPAALPALHLLLRARDAETAKGARECAAAIAKGRKPHLLSAAVRELVRRPTTGTAEALLRFVPHAFEERLQEDVWFGLDRLAKGQKALDPAFRQMRTDKVALRRAASGYVLARRGNAAEKGLARAMLVDGDVIVRLRVAQGLLASEDKSPIPTLIELLGTADVEAAWQAEELLHWAAGEGGPAESVGAGEVRQRKAGEAAWRKWWAAHEKKLDLSAVVKSYRRPGLVMVYEKVKVGERQPEHGMLWVGGCDGRKRWSMEGLAEVYDVKWLPGGRLLMTEDFRQGLFNRNGKFPPPPNYRLDPAGGATMRELSGGVTWEFAKRSLQRCAVQASGHLVLTSDSDVIAARPERGKRILHQTEDLEHRDRVRVRDPQPLPNGHFFVQFSLASSFLRLLEVDGDGTQITREIEVQERVRHNRSVGIEPLSNGNYLLARTTSGDVREFDSKGATVWRTSRLASFISSARPLPTDSYLVCDSYRAYEISRAGAVLWEQFLVADWIENAWPVLNLTRLGFDHPRPGDFDLDQSWSNRLRGVKTATGRAQIGHASLCQKLGPRGAPAVGTLLETQTSPSPQLRRAAYETLTKVTAPESLRDLIRGTKHENPAVRAAACQLLWKYANQGDHAAFALVARLTTDGSLEVRNVAASSLRSYQAHERIVIPALLAALEDHTALEKGPRVDQNWGSPSDYAALSLGDFHVHARRALPRLLELSKSADWRTRRAVMAVFGSLRLNAPSIEKALTTGVEDQHPSVRTQAERSLKRLKLLSK